MSKNSVATVVDDSPIDVPGYEHVKYDNRAIPLSQIQPPEYALRKAQLDDPKFLNLRDSIAKNGLFHNLLVRELKESTPENPLFAVIDGLQRYTALKQLNVAEPVPCRVVDMDEFEVAQAQIVANVVKLDTKPMELTIQLRRILNSNPTLTLSELAEMLSVGEKWVKDRLSLQNLCNAAKDLVAQGALKLNHAFTLSKLQPPEEQESFLQEGQTDVYAEFAGKIEARLKEIRSAHMAGRKAGERQFVAVPHLRKVDDFVQAINDEKVVNELLASENPKTLAEAIKVGMKWGVQLDPASVEAKKAKDEQIRLQREVANAQKQQDQARLRAQKALERANAMGVAVQEEEAAA